MKNAFFLTLLFCLIAFFGIQNEAAAQHQKANRKPHFILATDPLEWSRGRANLCATGLVFSKIGVCANGDFQAGQAVRNGFLIQSAQRNWSAEARLYPFGGPARVTDLFQKDSRTGCGFWEKKSAKPSPLAGFYIAPGFAKTTNDLAFTPQFKSETPIFEYKISQKSGTFAVGYDLHIWRFTIGGRWQTALGRATWRGPVDIFGTKLNSINYPFELNVTNRFGLSVGINF